MKKYLVLCFSLILLLTACGTGGGSSASGPTWQEQYDLGVRYLSEGKYEEAIIAFTAAIEIDPKRAPAYVGRGDAYTSTARLAAGDAAQLPEEALASYKSAVADYLAAIDLDAQMAEVYRKTAEVYLALGDTDAAAAILDRGFQATEDESLQQFLDELSGAVTIGEVMPGSAEYAELEEFLSDFGWYWPDYDSRTTVAAAELYGGTESLLDLLLSVPFCYSYPDSLYPGEVMEINWNGGDPLGRFEWGFGQVSVDKMDWLLKNIFNCSQSNIAPMKEPILAGQKEEVYCMNGYYYFAVGGIGGGYQATITNIEQSGLRYYVEYDLQNFYEEEPTPYRAQLSRKEIDGKSYWSLYDKHMAGRPCGDNLTWTLQAGTLTISGAGQMTDFNPYWFSDEPAPPWLDSYITSIEIGDGVTSIGTYAFWGCKYLTDVHIPESVTSIGDNAFWACSALESVSIPDSVTAIGNYAFQASGLRTFTIPSGVNSVNTGILTECDNLTSVTVAEGVARIELGAFYDCPNLKSLTLPRSITYFDSRTVDRCFSLSDIYYAGSQNEWNSDLSDYINIHYNSSGPTT